MKGIAYGITLAAAGLGLATVARTGRRTWDALRYANVEATVGPLQDQTLRTYYYVPTGWLPKDGRIVVLLHGADRRPAAMLDRWRRIADQQDVLLIAPEFSQRNFPGIRSYNLGGTVDEHGKLSDRREWAFPALNRAVDTVRQLVGAKRQNYILYGFSAGAQFALRDLFLTGAPRADLVIASSAGWYTMPTQSPWPCGIGGTEISVSDVFGKPLAIQIGQLDTNADDDFGDAGHESCARQQGKTRLERAKQFYHAGMEGARQKNIPFAWTLDQVQSAAHSIEAHANDASRWLVRL